MDKALGWFASTWVFLIAAYNVITILGTFVAAGGSIASRSFLNPAWTMINAEIEGPFDFVLAFVEEMLLLSPALGALYWRDQRRKSSYRHN